MLNTDDNAAENSRRFLTSYARFSRTKSIINGVLCGRKVAHKKPHKHVVAYGFVRDRYFC